MLRHQGLLRHPEILSQALLDSLAGLRDVRDAHVRALTARCMYAQTNIQLFHQLYRDGYSRADRELVRNAYELAMELFAGRFQPSGKVFIAHVVGTASILASLRLPAAVVAAGLLHSVYVQGDFGSMDRGVSAEKRRSLSRLLGPEVEELVAKVPTLHWGSATMQLALADPEKLSVSDRHVVMLRLADYLEHLLDLDLLYYGDRERRHYMSVGDKATAIPRKLGLNDLEVEIKEALRRIESTERPVDLPKHGHRESFVVTPRSCCKRFYSRAAQACTRVLSRLKSSA
jgi:(p)ppGpp synthase/HD superfamily hydrolase